jgi:hypothetical protein
MRMVQYIKLESENYLQIKRQHKTNLRHNIIYVRG